jgi:hypothetical protein
MDFIDEVDTIFHDAQEYILTSSGIENTHNHGSRGKSNKDQLFEIVEADEN